MASSWWRRAWVLLIPTLCVLQPMLLAVSHGCYAEERVALMELRASLVRENSSYTAPPPQWGLAGDDDCCSWERVRCSNATRRVTHLHLSRVHVAPGLADYPDWTWRPNIAVFAALPELQYLDLSDNKPMEPLSFDGFKNLNNLQKLYLSSNNISGILPSFLFSLPHIEVLDLSENLVEGPIPISSSSNLSVSLTSLLLNGNSLNGTFSFFWFKDLINLLDIDLSGNANLHVDVNISGWMPRFQLRTLYLSGCDVDKGILANPVFLRTQHQLEGLDLSNNNLPGPMPNWLFTEGSNLAVLRLGSNSLTGSLDPILYPQTYLEFIDIANNHIVGQLPANISSVFPILISLIVSNNNLSGEIPMSLCRINQIESIILSDNYFSGEMPACVFTDLPNLSVLMISNNHLGGPIFEGRDNLSVGSLSEMHLNGNKFEGALPRNFSGDMLWKMDLRDNMLSGILDTSSWNFSMLQLLDVSNNYMTGEILPQLCNLINIRFLELANNNFTGHLRCNTSWLLSLNVSMNSFSGDVSLEHFNTSSLNSLDVMYNKLTGNLSWVHTLQSVSVLYLGHNKFDGPIPPTLCELTYLRVIDLSHNKLHGKVPPCIGAMRFPNSIDIATTSTSSPLYVFPSPIYEGDVTFGTKGTQLTYNPAIFDLMSGIDLSGNSLSGEIPRELGKLTHVKSLNLSRNALTGPIPASLANMSDVESLDLSHNKLTGAIPLELTQLRSLAVFFVAYNNLSGCAPSSGQFATFDMDSYKGNSQIKMNCSSSPPGLKPDPIPPHDDVVVDAGPYVIGAASFVLAFWATIAFSFCHSTGRRMLLKL